MPNLRETFLAQFDERWRSPLVEFAKRIASSEADVTIFMARKAACLAHCFEELKFAPTSSRTWSSNLVLDADLSWIRGRSVELVDDTLITGTSLYEATKRIREAGPASVRTTVFCSDRDNWVRDLVEPDPPYLLLPNHDVTSFSVQEVRALGLIPRPYTIDFPLYDNIRITAGRFDSALTGIGWEADDISTAGQSQFGVSVTTMTPPAWVMRQLDQRLGWPVSESSQLCKVRLYSRLRNGSRPAYYIKVLPIVALDPLNHNQIGFLWEGLKRNAPNELQSIGETLSTPKDRLRLIQFILARSLFDLWLEHVSSVIPGSVTAELNARQIDFSFPPNVRSDVVRLLRSDTVTPLTGVPKFVSFPIPVRTPITKAEPQVSAWDMTDVQAQLTRPFLDFYNQKELPARRLVMRLGRKAFADPIYRDLVDRLKEGISLPELRSLISGVFDIDDAGCVVSTFLDSAIDRGVAVPVLVDDGYAVYRAFRHGEDVKFTEVEARLICLMVAEVASSLKVKVLPRLVVEKLIVLMIKAGLQLGIMERWSGTLGDRRSVGVRFSLQGAVAQVGPDVRPYRFAPGDSLALSLSKWGYLDERSGGYEVVAVPERPPTTTAAESQARAVGAAVGLALANVKARPRDNELTLIASCMTEVEVASALAAEVDIFARRWSLLATMASRPELSGADADELVRRDELYQAVNSGLWKWESFQSGAPADALREWGERVGKGESAVLATGVINSAFPRSDEVAIAPQFTAFLRDLAGWMLETNLALRRFRIALLRSGTEAAEDPAVERLSHQIRSLDEQTVTAGRQLPLRLGLAGVNEVRADLDSLSARGNALLDRADALLTPFGRPRSFRAYRHVLTIKVLDKSREHHDRSRDHLTALIQHQIALSLKSSSSVSTILLNHALRAWHADIAVASGGQFSRDALMRLLADCLEGAASAGIPISCAVLVDLDETDELVRTESESEISARNIQLRVHRLLKNVRVDPQAIRIMSSHSEDSCRGALAELSGFTSATLIAGKSRRVESGDPDRKSFHVVTAAIEMKQRPGDLGPVDLGVITVVPEEAKAFLDLLREHGKVVRRRKDGAIFYEGSLPSEDAKRHRVVLTQQLKQGNRSVVSAHDRLILTFHPAVIALVGIGGSMHEDARLCDVVIADQIIWYQSATTDIAGTRIKGEASEITAQLRVNVNDFFVNHGVPYPLPFPSPSGNGQALLHFGPIGTGEDVIRYRDADVRAWLKSFNYKTLALETEAGGLGQGFYESGLTLGFQAKGYLVVRGISDHADADKNDRWRIEASRNASEALQRVLATMPPLGELLSS